MVGVNNNEAGRAKPLMARSPYKVSDFFRNLPESAAISYKKAAMRRMRASRSMNDGSDLAICLL